MIHLENITKSFGNLQVLRGIDLEIEKGDGGTQYKLLHYKDTGMERQLG